MTIKNYRVLSVRIPLGVYGKLIEIKKIRGDKSISETVRILLEKISISELWELSKKSD